MTAERWKYLLTSVLGVDVDGIISETHDTVLKYCTGYRYCNVAVPQKNINGGAVIRRGYILFGSV